MTVQQMLLSPGGAPPVFVGATTQQVAASATVDITLPSGLAVNDYVFIGFVADNIGGIPTVNSAGWTVIYQPDVQGVPTGTVIRKIMGTTPDTVCNITNPVADEMAVVCQAWRGVNSGTPEDGVTIVKATGATGLPDSGSITPTTDNTVVISFGGLDDDNATGIAAPSGYTNLSWTAAGGVAESTSTAMVSSKEVVTPAAENPGAYTASTGDDQWIAATWALRNA